MKCPGCARDNLEGAAFCDGCGTALERTCSKCGAELRGDARFCDSCGERVVTAATDVRSRTPEHLVEKILKERTGIEGERRNVTVMFVDAKGFTPLSERLDAEQVYSFTQGCTERMLAAVHRHEGTVTQFTGDGIVALFGAPIAHEDSARRAVAAALDMQGSLSSYVAETGVDTAFRVGLNTGPVVVGRVGEDLSMDYTAVGDTVNLAARMEQIAEPGAVFMTSHTYQGASDYFECVDLGLREVKGKSEPVHVYRPIVATGARTRIDAAVARGLSPFVGRDRDIGVLMGLWEEANAGRGQIVMISGEPGIGKSRLLLEFRRALGDDVVWREAHCISYGEEIPYLPVIELVKNGFGINDSDDDGTIIAKVDTDVALWSPETQKM
ncbi:MAG: adenylate/guanylate cyclase domain-containing protein, partial [Actinomycetota bacterium]